MRSPRLRPGLVAALLVITAGCDCGGAGIQTLSGSLAVVEPPTGGGTPRVGHEATFSVGFVPGGGRGSVVIEVRNLGQGRLSLAGVERIEGDALAPGATPTPEAPFALAWEPGATLEAGDSANLTAHFLAPSGAEQTEWRLVLRLRADGASPDAESVLLTLTATTALVACEIPTPLRAGAVKIGTSRRMGLSITNTFPTAQRLIIGVPTSERTDALAFLPAGGTPAGDVWLASGESVELAWDFQPTEVRLYAATVELQRAESCPPQQLALEGEGVERLLTWTPQTLDFGAAWPETSVERAITFRNAGLEPVTLDAFAVTAASAPFAPAARVGTSLVIPALAEVELPLTFSPSEHGERGAVFRFETSLEDQPIGHVTLRGFGGGPVAEVAPNPLVFGAVAWFPAAAPAANVHRRRLILSNVGTTVSPEDPRNQLFLGTPDASGAHAAPFFLLTALDGLTEPGEFSLELGEDFNPAVGLPAIPGSNRRAMQVVFTPTSPGPRSALLSLYTNDPRRPVVDVTVQASVVELPPCRYGVRPARLDFGILRPGETRDLEVELVNLGTAAGERCLLSELALEEGTDTAFSILAPAPSESLELAPGASHRVTVRLTAGESEQLVERRGALTLRMSSPTEPVVRVPLSGFEGRTCLLITPDVLEFGTQAVGCGSAQRASTLYNVCDGDIVIRSIELTHAAGQLPGGSACAGPGACPEFALSGLPPIPAGGLRLASGESISGLSVRYRPIDFGRDVGTLGVTFAENGGSSRHAVIVLGGTGDTAGANVDVFQGDGQPVADILLSIDGSCSMSNEQDQLAANLGLFFEELTKADVDFHIAVIKGQFGSSNPDEGLFLSGPLHPDAILTRRSPDILQQFREKVRVGAAGGNERCFDPAYKSLTGPFALGPNRGFLRAEAPLSLICISDDVDHDATPLLQHLAAFRALKRSENLFSVSAIAPFADSSCGRADDGRYAQAVALTDGVRAELCEANWAPFLRDFGKKSAGSRSRFVLTSPADPAQPIEVFVEGSPVPAQEPAGGANWSYDPATNVLAFTPFAIPEPGMSLEVHYTAVCQ